MYKKVNLKFTYDKFRREDRVEQTLKARESSRFKRLSYVRNLENTNLSTDESSIVFENDSKKVDNKVEKTVRPPSRLEMLKKWKEEQQKRREEEMKKKPPPFKVGRALTKKPALNKAPQGVNMTFKKESTRIADSKIPPKSTNVPPAKNTLGIKTTKISGLQKSANQVSSIPKTFSKTEKAVTVKTNSKTGLKEKSSCVKPTSYVSYQSKPISMISSKPAKKPSVETLKSVQSQKVTEVPKSVPVVPKSVPLKTNPRGVPVVKVQSKIQVPQTTRQPGTGIPKFSVEPGIKTPVKRTQIKGSSVSTESNGLQKRLPIGVAKKVSDNPPKTAKNVETSKKVQSSKDADNMELTFNSDISIIKPSFAPANFVFEPPADLVSFAFDDDDDEDDDPFLVMERVKKYLSRTSTPEKLPGSNSSSKRCSTSSNETPHKLPEESASDNCNEVQDLMHTTAQPIKDEIIVRDVNDECINTSKAFLKSCYEPTDSNIEISDLISITSLSLKGETIKDINDKPQNLDAPTMAKTVVIEFDKSSENFHHEEGTLGNTNDEIALQKNLVVPAVDVLNHETQCVAHQTTEKQSTKSNDINSLHENSVESVSSPHNDETQCDAAAIDGLNNALSNKVSLDDSLGIMDLKSVVGASSKTGDDETHRHAIVQSLKSDASSDNCTLDDSLGIIDLNIESPLPELTNLMSLENDEAFKNDTVKPTVTKPVVVKSAGAIPKRTSMLKSISTLEAIFEVSELDSSKEKARTVDSKQDICVTPRRSKRLSERKYIKDIPSDLERIIDIESPQSSVTPRRSARLQKAATPKLDDAVSSPFVTRRSMRLIDLNTPERRESSKSNLTFKFEKLNLNDSENRDPQLLLENLDSPGANKSKKVSLLYSPEKRRSMRKSIRGDLMSFSPA